MAKATELRELDDTELLSRYSEAKEELFNLRFQHATGQLDAVSRLGQLKRDIARITTIVREREIDIAEAQFDEERSGQASTERVPAEAERKEA